MEIIIKESQCLPTNPALQLPFSLTGHERSDRVDGFLMRFPLSFFFASFRTGVRFINSECYAGLLPQGETVLFCGEKLRENSHTIAIDTFDGGAKGYHNCNEQRSTVSL